jgi:hypothetical protein
MLRYLPLSSCPVLAGAGAVAASALMALALVPAADAAAPRIPAPAAADAPAPSPAVPHLDWQACGGGFFCATAAVPLDYRHPTARRSASR